MTSTVSPTAAPIMMTTVTNSTTFHPMAQQPLLISRESGPIPIPIPNMRQLEGQEEKEYLGRILGVF